jgi:hypothetical protein
MAEVRTAQLRVYHPVPSRHPGIAGEPVVDVSAWTDVRRTEEVFGGTTAVETCVHAVDDVLRASPQQMRNRVRDIVKTCRNLKLACATIRAEGITGLGESGEDLTQSGNGWI